MPELVISNGVSSKISKIQGNCEQDYKLRKLVGSDITLAWDKTSNFNQMKLFESSNPTVIAIYSKGLVIWSGDSKSLSNQVTCVLLYFVSLRLLLFKKVSEVQLHL